MLLLLLVLCPCPARLSELSVGLGDGLLEGGRTGPPGREPALQQESTWLPAPSSSLTPCVPVAWRRGLERGRPGLAVTVMLSSVSRCAASGLLQHLSRRSYFMMCTLGAFLKRFLHLLFV